MKSIKIIILLIVLINLSYPQENSLKDIHQVPFLSSNNIIELSIQNLSEKDLSQIKIELIDAPDWIKFKTVQESINELKQNSEQNITFQFSVGKEAVINQEQLLKFLISTSDNQIFYKEVNIIISPPVKFELFQNYPNPFNSSSIIEFQIPHRSFITIKIYDILGREVATLMEELKEAGYYEVVVEAYQFSSGVYFYQLTALDESGSRYIDRKKMLLVK